MKKSAAFIFAWGKYAVIWGICYAIVLALPAIRPITTFAIVLAARLFILKAYNLWGDKGFKIARTVFLIGFTMGTLYESSLFIHDNEAMLFMCLLARFIGLVCAIRPPSLPAPASAASQAP